jgi:integrase
LEATEQNRAKALRKEAEYRRLVEEGKTNLLKIRSIPFNEAAKQFLEWAEGEYQAVETYRRIKSSFSYIQHFFGRAAVASLTVGHIEDFKAARRKIGVKEISIRHDLHALSTFFQYAMKKQWARQNLIRSVDIPSDKDAVRINVLSPVTEKLYFDTCLWMDRAAAFIPSRDRHAYRDLHDFGRLIIQQGCRPEEVRELLKTDVDLIGARMFVRSGKSRSATRRLKLTVESFEILVRRMEVPGPYVFPSPNNPARCRAAHWRTHDMVIEAARGKEGLAEFVQYDLRHTFATRAVLDGMPLPILARILGHGDLKSIQKYVHVTDDHAEQEMERIERDRLSRASSAVRHDSSRRAQPPDTSSGAARYSGSEGSAQSLGRGVPRAKGKEIQ